jgi:hypothetical protein
MFEIKRHDLVRRRNRDLGGADGLSRTVARACITIWIGRHDFLYRSTNVFKGITAGYYHRTGFLSGTGNQLERKLSSTARQAIIRCRHSSANQAMESPTRSIGERFHPAMFDWIDVEVAG